MIFKTLFRTALLAVAVIGPMLFFRVSEIWSGAKQAVSALLPAGDSWRSGSDQGEASKSLQPASLTGQPIAPLEGPAVQSLEEVLRFDVSTGWVMSRWSRVSTGMAQLQLQGYRVLLVTGTARDDLAGSLTYYFNPQQQVQKITFNGTTGDATRLVRLLTTRYGFARRLANDGGLFVYEVPNSKGGVRSVLRIRPSGVVRADEPYQRFHVDLMIERPEKG